MHAPRHPLPLRGPLQPRALRRGQHWRSPQDAYFAARAWVPWLLAGAVLLGAIGLGGGLLHAQQAVHAGSAYRIIYVHVPATWVALFLFALFAGWSVIGLLSSSRLAPLMTEALAPTGALFALLALWTGSLWGKPVSGLWWEWDARRIADLALLSAFVAAVIVREVVDDTRHADHLTAVLALVGTMVVAAALSSVALLPQVNGRHNAQFAGPAGGGTRLMTALAATTVSFALYASAAALMRLRCVILERERAAEWVDTQRVRR